MKTYTVKEISKMLGKNPETVRRWIREEKLKAGQDSKKGGNYVTEEDLRAFLKSTPKYAALLGGAALLMPGMSASIPFAISGMIVGLYDLLENSLKDKNAQIDSEAIVRSVEASIVQCNQSIRKKRAVIVQLEEEIRNEEQQIKALSAALAQMKNQHIEDMKEE